MKCDELKAETIVPQGSAITLQMYPKGEADAALAAKDKEIAELESNERRLKRALYKACTNWACAKMEYEQFDSNVFMFGVTTTDKEVSWESMMKKCQAKAEEYR